MLISKGDSMPINIIANLKLCWCEWGLILAILQAQDSEGRITVDIRKVYSLSFSPSPKESKLF